MFGITKMIFERKNEVKKARILCMKVQNILAQV